MKICPAGSWLFQRQPTLWLPNAYLWKTIRAVAEQSCSYKGGSGPQQIYQQQKQQCINHPGLFHCHGCVSHRPMFRLPVVVLSSVRQFSSISSVNEMSSGCFARAQQGESNDEVTTLLLLDQRGVWLRLTHNLWTVQKGSHARSYVTTGIALRVTGVTYYLGKIKWRHHRGVSTEKWCFKTDLYRTFNCAQASVWTNCWHLTPNSKSWSHKYNQVVFKWRLQIRELQNLYSEQNIL